MKILIKLSENPNNYKFKNKNDAINFIKNALDNNNEIEKYEIIDCDLEIKKEIYKEIEEEIYYYYENEMFGIGEVYEEN